MTRVPRTAVARARPYRGCFRGLRGGRSALGAGSDPDRSWTGHSVRIAGAILRLSGPGRGFPCPGLCGWAAERAVAPGSGKGRGCADDPRNEDRAAVRQIARGVAYSERPSKAVRTKREGVRNPSDIPPRSSELFTRLELVTSSLPRKCSTTELKQQLLAL